MSLLENSPPPTKPPRGVKPVKETSGLLMSVIRTLSASETNEQRDREKANLEAQYKICDQKLDDLVSKHESDLTEVVQLFGGISLLVSENRGKIHRVKENLQECKKLLRCRKDELKNLWREGLEYKYMIQSLQEIEKMMEVPNRLVHHMAHKQYLHATQILIDNVSLDKDIIEEVDSLKEISSEIEQKKEQLHIQVLSELHQQLFNKPAQRVLALLRQGSGRDGFMISSPLQRSTELRLSARRSAAHRNIMESAAKLETSDGKNDGFEVEEDLEVNNLEENSQHFMAILVKCLALLDKLPFAINDIECNMQKSLSLILDRTSHHIKDFADLQSNNDGKTVLKELIQTLFGQYKEVADTHSLLLKYARKASKAHNIDLHLYTIKFYWEQVQTVLQSFLANYLDIQNMNSEIQINSMNDTDDLSSYFSRRKQQSKKISLFKFDGSSSALTLSNTLKSSKNEKSLVCKKHPNNILVMFIPLISFIDDIEQYMDVKQGSSHLYYFITQEAALVYLRKKSDEIIDEIEEAVKASDAWKATLLLDTTTDYKPILQSTVAVERCIREWKAILKALPLYSELIAQYACKALKEYKDTCNAAYQGIVQPYSEDRKICSAAWLKDDDISRFLKSLPNWLNLKAQQEYQARSERISRKNLRRGEQPSEEESPEDVRIRNRREAEILAGNLGEGGVSAGEILSDMAHLKELAQLQESMEWFSIRMFKFASEFRQEPSGLTPPKINDQKNCQVPSPVSAVTLQQITSIAQEFDELANTCLLLLHLEVRVQCFYYLLAQTHFNKETHEPDPKVLELSRVLANVDEAMTTSLHPRKCKYIFEGLGHLIAKILISSAQYMHVIDEAGIQRTCRNIFALQQTLTNITMTREVALDHARHYFQLFFLTPEDILNNIVEKGAEFSELEYINAFQLLSRSKKGIHHQGSLKSHLDRLSDILGEVGVTV